MPLNPKATATAKDSLSLSPYLRHQDEPSTYPSSHSSVDNRVFHQFPFQSFDPSISHASQQPSSNRQTSFGTSGLASAFAADTSMGISFLPPASSLNVKTGFSSAEHEVSFSLEDHCTGKQVPSQCDNNDEARWGLEVQQKYDNFLERERSYISEGLLDRFPPGSRLFVGQLCHKSLVVSKRDCSWTY